jgi:hypothetical protein
MQLEFYGGSFGRYYSKSANGTKGQHKRAALVLTASPPSRLNSLAIPTAPQ